MKTKTATTLLCLIIIISSIPQVFGKRTRYIFSTKYTFENKGEEPYEITERDEKFTLFLNNRWQKTNIRDSSHALIEKQYDEDGNPVAVIDLPSEIPAGGILISTLDYLIESEEREKPDIDLEEAGTVDDVPTNLVQEHTIKTETFRWSEEIESLAANISKDSSTVLETVIGLIDWVDSTVSYCNFEIPLYPEETLEGHQGDCDDQAILLISMLRSLGIPAFLQVGVIFSESLSSSKTSYDGHVTYHQDGVGWHGWAMVYVPPWGWIPVDLTLTSTSEPLEMIENAPEYARNVVTAYNVSKQSYIENSRSYRKFLIESDLYITISDSVAEERATPWSYTIMYIGAGLAAGSAIVVVVILISKRRY